MTAPPEWYERLLEYCPPREHSEPRWEWPCYLPRYEGIVNLLDMPARLDGAEGLMDHQRLALRLLSEYDPDTGIPRFKELLFLTPRQVGKTTIHMVSSIERLLLRSRPGRIAYAAQTYLQGAAKLDDDWWPMVESTKLHALGGMAKRSGTARAGIFTDEGGWIRVVSSSEHSVRGITRLDLALLDEALAERNDDKERALAPAMLTVPDSQMFLTSTPGTEESLYLRAKLDNALAVVDVPESQIGLLEFGATDDSDHLDPRTWRSASPALDRTIPEESYRSLSQSMTELRFRQELLGQWVASLDEGGIPWEQWDRMAAEFADGYESEGRPIILGVDCTPDQSRVTVCASDGFAVWLAGVISPAVEVVERVEMLAKEIGAVGVVHQREWALMHHTEGMAEAVRAEAMDRPTWYEACGRTLSGVLEGHMILRDDDVLRNSNGQTYRRSVGSRWVWDRREPWGDISPMVALTLAYAGSHMYDWESKVGITLL